MELMITLPEYEEDLTAQLIYSWFENHLKSVEGICFYCHPVFLMKSDSYSELTIITREYYPIIVRCCNITIDNIDSIDNSIWTIDERDHDSLLLMAEDDGYLLKSKIQEDRVIRKEIEEVISVLAFPSINKSDFIQKFGNEKINPYIIWSDADLSSFIQKLKSPLSDDGWSRLLSIIQGVKPLTKGIGGIDKKSDKIGNAIRNMDRDIAILDDIQLKAALQIPPGPQRIRGLAGTGKTVLLAMRAAKIHYLYPEKKILFTFNTKSLYNQVKWLITKFYRVNGEYDPDWNYLHIRHAWGSSNRPGVYSDVCSRLKMKPLIVWEARKLNPDSPFDECCKQVLENPVSISPEYDYIFLDEAQDFHSEYFKLLYKLSHPPHRITWVFDELQSLFGDEMPSSEDLFGSNEDGTPRVTLDGTTYLGEIEKDIILYKSYRCPHEVIMLAHALGLGLYNEMGPVQMPDKRDSWKSYGYVIESGDLIEGSEVTIYRPPENSPNPINRYYSGGKENIDIKRFDEVENELNWIANSILSDIRDDNVLPENIIVICLDALKKNAYLPPLQLKLDELGIPSVIPGLVSDSSKYAEPGKVTLSTVFLAKGNESYIVYIFSFNAIYNYVEELQNRNRAFTAISRSKGWVRISGVGDNMVRAEREIGQIMSDFPRFHFKYPNIDKIRNINAGTVIRQKKVGKGFESINELLNIDDAVIESISERDPELLEKAIKKLKKRNPLED